MKLSSLIHPCSVSLVLLWLCAGAAAERAAQPAAEPVSHFDPQRHMRVDEVEPGMKGYGLSVFRGAQIERFDVEVISILRNFNPRQDVILVRSSGAGLEHTGTISGMSGSPIFLRDNDGRERMVGAIAYGWRFSKDPIAGVQPIEYMLALPEPTEAERIKADGATMKTEGVTMDGVHDSSSFTLRPSSTPARWSWEDSVPLPGSDQVPATYPMKSWNSMAPNPQVFGRADDAMRLRPLATPLMSAGVPANVLRELEPILEAHGMVPLQAGGSGSPAGDAPNINLEPGAALAVAILTGDMDFTAVGTCTEVIGDRIFGFGHALVSEGPVVLPMGSGQVDAVIPSLVTSFKLGSLAQMKGALYADHSVGVAGRLGDAPPMAPIHLRVMYEDGSIDERYRFEAALHPRFTPMVSAAAMASALGSSRDLPQYHTIEYDIELEFANGEVVKLNNSMVNAWMGDIFYTLGGPMLAAANNPFERVLVSRISGTVRVVPEAMEAEVLSVHAPRRTFRPGETVRLFVTYRPFRQPEAVMPVEFELPDDLADGEYHLSVSDWQRYLMEERMMQPFRFSAESIEGVFAVIRDITSVRRNALYLRLQHEGDGVAIGRIAMPHLPASRRQVLLESGRSDVTPFVSSTVKTVPTRFEMDGAADFTISIDRHAPMRVQPERRADASE